MGLFLSRSFSRAAHLSSFVSFFVRSESPFLRPDPPQRQAVARRSCQGWSPLRRPPAGLGLDSSEHGGTIECSRAGSARRRSEGSPRSGADLSRHNLVFGGSKDPNHDAVMRIGSEAPRQRTHSLLRRDKPWSPSGHHHLEPSSATHHKRTGWAKTVGCLLRAPVIVRDAE